MATTVVRSACSCGCPVAMSVNSEIAADSSASRTRPTDTLSHHSHPPSAPKMG
jgi:hypothetical protein